MKLLRDLLMSVNFATFASLFYIIIMSTWKQIAFMVLDQLKLSSDDSYFNEEHIYFLLKEYRGLLLKQNYSDIKKDIPESNYQTICLDLIEVPAIPDEECEGGSYLRSKEPIPYLMNIGSSKVYPIDYFHGGNITLVSMQRMRYVGYNRWLPNIIYAAFGPDSYLYLKSGNPQFLYMQRARLTGIFEDPEKATELQCEGDTELPCDPMDRPFPMEETLVPQLIELVVKTLRGPVYLPEDKKNNSDDDLPEVVQRNSRNG